MTTNLPNPLVRVTVSDAYNGDILDTFVTDEDYRKFIERLKDRIAYYDTVEEYEAENHYGEP